MKKIFFILMISSFIFHGTSISAKLLNPQTMKAKETTTTQNTTIHKFDKYNPIPQKGAIRLGLSIEPNFRGFRVIQMPSVISPGIKFSLYQYPNTIEIFDEIGIGINFIPQTQLKEPIGLVISSVPWLQNTFSQVFSVIDNVWGVGINLMLKKSFAKKFKDKTGSFLAVNLGVNNFWQDNSSLSTGSMGISFGGYMEVIDRLIIEPQIGFDYTNLTRISIDGVDGKVEGLESGVDLVLGLKSTYYFN